MNTRTVAVYHGYEDLWDLYKVGFAEQYNWDVIRVSDYAFQIYGDRKGLFEFASDLGFERLKEDKNSALESCLATLYCYKNHEHAYDIVGPSFYRISIIDRASPNERLGYRYLDYSDVSSAFAEYEKQKKWFAAASKDSFVCIRRLRKAVIGYNDEEIIAYPGLLNFENYLNYRGIIKCLDHDLEEYVDRLPEREKQYVSKYQFVKAEDVLKSFLNVE